MAGVPYVFASATTSIPLSELDVNFNTPVTIGNTSVGLGNTVTSFGNVTLTNATISGNLTATSITGGTANGVVYLSSGNVVTANPTVLDFDGNNLGLGVTPSAWGSTWQGIQFKSSPNFLSGGTDLNLIANAYNDGTNYKYIDSYSYASRYYQYNGQHQWYTTQSTQGANNTISFTQAMTLDNSGNLLVGQTSQLNNGKLSVYQSSTGGAIEAKIVGSGTGYAVYTARVDNTANLLHAFYYNTYNSFVGSITTNGTITVYNTTSDYRLKNNQAPLIGSGSFIDALKPKTWNWAQDGSKGAGFIAHEFAEVSPSSVNGTKDAVDADGKPVYQAMQASSAEVIANLVAEIQSLRKRVAQLESK